MRIEADCEQTLAVAPPRRMAAEWTVGKVSLLAFFGLLFLAQLALGYAGIVTGGGIERYIRERADFRAVLTGGLTIHEGRGHLLYDEASKRTVQQRVLAPYFLDNLDAVLPNSHPPFESLFAAPLMGLPYAVPFALWTALEVAALGVSLWLLAGAAPVNVPTRWLLFAGALAYHPFHLVLWTGQSSPLVLLGFCGLYAALQRRQGWWAGAGLALILLKTATRRGRSLYPHPTPPMANPHRGHRDLGNGDSRDHADHRDRLAIALRALSGEFSGLGDRAFRVHSGDV